MLDSIDDLRREAADVRQAIWGLRARIEKLQALISRELPQGSPGRAALDELVFVLGDVDYLGRKVDRAARGRRVCSTSPRG